MKHTLCFITILLGSLLDLYANNENDSLLKVLDKVISERLVYTEKKEATIKELKAKKKEQKTLDDMYRLNSEILHQYETFVCDSAEQYINENIEIAKKLDNKTYLLEGRLQLAFVFTEISNQQLHAFICRDVCNIRMTHITRLGRIEIMKTFKSIMNRMILRYVALLLAICRGGYSAVIFHCFIGNNMDQQSKYQK